MTDAVQINSWKHLDVRVLQEAPPRIDVVFCVSLYFSLNFHRIHTTISVLEVSWRKIPSMNIFFLPLRSSTIKSTVSISSLMSFIDLTCVTYFSILGCTRSIYNIIWFFLNIFNCPCRDSDKTCCGCTHHCRYANSGCGTNINYSQHCSFMPVMNAPECGRDRLITYINVLAHC